MSTKEIERLLSEMSRLGFGHYQAAMMEHRAESDEERELYKRMRVRLGLRFDQATEAYCAANAWFKKAKNRGRRAE